MGRGGLTRTAIPCALVTAALLAGCGNSRTPVPNLTAPARPAAFRTLSYPAAGVSFRAPSNWPASAKAAPLVTIVSSGDAVVAIWRYPRSQPLPQSRAQLRAARARLIAAARAKDPGLELLSSQVELHAGIGSIVLDTLERIGSELRRVRSTHLFAYGQEVVLEEYAPPALFHRVDHEVFSPLMQSLVLSPARPT